jgi:hypothetical protein
MNLILGTSGARLAFKVAALGAMATLLPLKFAAAQQRRPPTIVTRVSADGNGPDFDTRTIQRGFNLFGSGDAAFSGMHATGNYGTAITNYGDCDTTLRNCQNNGISGAPSAPYFEVEWVYGVPPSQYVKIKKVAPSIANALGGGWMAGYNRTVLGQPKRFAPSDNTLGQLFAGTASTADGSCTDHTGFANGFFLAGLQLLAVNDCPVTWGSLGWVGAHPIDQAGWKGLFDLQGDNFTWDFWRVPGQFQRLDKPFMGTRVHTYGETDDFNSEVLKTYGSVVPGGSGAPGVQGYPLGLKVHFDAFNFGVPTVSDAYFVQATIVNRSEDLWGTGIDYDSLYFGFSEGTLFSSQNASRYVVLDKGMVIYHDSNVQGATGPCADPNRAPYAGNSCTASGSSNRGYGAGSTAFIILKSPIGDLRNKLFTHNASGGLCTSSDPFCDPTHPLAGDTITFNHQAFGSYGDADTQTWGSGVRAAFGLLAGDEVNTLAGRSYAGWSINSQWRTFRSEDWPNDVAHYNKYAPPGWDYNHDGTPDTVAAMTCGRNGCAGVDSDTMPGGFYNARGNIGGIQSWGPFSLKAGDTTSVVYAHVGGSPNDSARFWSQVNAVIDLYLNFYLAPEAPPPVHVVSTSVVPGTNATGTANPNVQIFFSDDPEVWVDPFLSKIADDVASSAAFDSLRFYNPWLPDSLRARAHNNLQRIEIYKSCDGGNSWTSDANCDGDPATQADGTSDVFGWRTYAILDVDANQGNVPNSYSDPNVDGGRTYTYAFVGKSRGASFLVQTPYAAGNGADTVRFAPTIRNPLSASTSDPNVVAVYVPAGKPAGFQAAAVSFTQMPTATVPFTVDLTDNAVAGSYRAVFGNEILVARDSNTTTNALEQSIVTVRRRETVDLSGSAVDSIIRSESFTYANTQDFLVEGTGTAGATTTSGNITTLTTLYSGLGFVLADANGVPLFGSTTLAAGKATPASLFGRTEYPGFTIDADNSVAGTFNAGSESQFRGPATRASLTGALPSDTIEPRGVVNANMVQWREPSSTKTADGGGGYSIAWADDPFGVARGFVLNLTNPSATEAEVQATLEARKVGTTGLTDAETAALVGDDQVNLVPVKVPFTVRNTDFNRAVDIAMVRRVSNTFLLGNGNDTISVQVPEDTWIPGDRLIFIENVTEDSTIGGRLVVSGGQPVQRTRRAVTFKPAVLGCNSVRESCNPVQLATRGATGYEPMHEGDSTRFAYYVGFTPSTEYGFSVTPAVTGEQITQLTDSAMALIKVVPNPFVIYSAYQTDAANARLLFAGLPPRGTLRIYTVAGQFVQQITWEPSDLQGDGDLFWDMRTREGIDIASGLYLWVVTAPQDPSDPTSAPIRARGKFVVIRGDSR